jgi:hypothetical protein
LFPLLEISIVIVEKRKKKGKKDEEVDPRKIAI